MKTKTIETMNSYELESLESRLVGKVDDAIECIGKHLFPIGKEKVDFMEKPFECRIDGKTTKFVGAECNEEEGVVIVTDDGKHIGIDNMTIWESVEVCQRLLVALSDLRREN